MRKSLALLFVLAGCSRQPLAVTFSKTTLLANGYDRSVIRICGSDVPPRIELLADHHFATIEAPRMTTNCWQTAVDADVMPGLLQIRVSAHNRHIDKSFTLLPQITDSAGDGTPDFLRLEDESDRQAFRQWITYLAEIQYFIPPERRSSEITDCSALVRYSYREAMRNHDAAWLQDARLPIVEASSSIRKYSFPHTLLGPRIFRTRAGVYSPGDLTNGSFAEFADAKTIQQFNMFFVSRDVGRAQPGDILFYRRETIKGVSYHSMVFLGASKVKPDGEIYVVYHTGPDGTNQGEIRRLTLTQLLHFPNPQWQSIAANPLFLGVYRWNILKALS